MSVRFARPRAIAGRCALLLAIVAAIILSFSARSLAAGTGALVGVFPGNDELAIANGWPAGYFLPADVYPSSYLTAMNRWQGHANSVINFYDNFDSNMFTSETPQ